MLVDIYVELNSFTGSSPLLIYGAPGPRAPPLIELHHEEVAGDLFGHQNAGNLPGSSHVDFRPMIMIMMVMTIMIMIMIMMTRHDTSQTGNRKPEIGTVYCTVYSYQQQTRPIYSAL